MNGTLISPQSDTYHYKAYLQTLTNFDTKDGRTVLRPQGWFNGINPPPQWTANKVDTTSNAGAGHADYQNLAANTKLLLANMSAERGQLARGKVRHCLCPSPRNLSHRQSLGARGRNQDEVSL